MLTAADARTIVQNTINEKAETIRKNAIEYCETVIADHIEKAAKNELIYTNVTVETGISIIVVKAFLIDCGYKVSVNGKELLISWNK